MSLEFKLPEDFKPLNLEELGGEETRSRSKHWIYLKDGSAKSHMEATGEETFNWIQSITRDLPFKDESGLDLPFMRAVFIDYCLTIREQEDTKLFGSSSFWEGLPEWQRIYNKGEK